MENTEFSYRKMILSDIVYVYLLDQRHFLDATTLNAFIIDNLYDDRLSFICQKENTIVGSIIAEQNKEIVSITSICVDRAYGNMGIGKSLLQICITEIERICPKVTIQLMVSVENIKAVRLYEKFGFVKTKEYCSAYYDGSNGMTMEKRLS